MAFRPPTFNLTANLWRLPNVVTNPPDLTFDCNLSIGRRVQFGSVQLPAANTTQPQVNVPATELLCPKLTDIRGVQHNGASDLVEVPAGSKRYYIVWFVEDVAKGFGNEYRFGLILQTNYLVLLGVGPYNTWNQTAWPVPTP